MQTFHEFMYRKSVEPLMCEIAVGLVYCNLDPEQWLTKWVRNNVPLSEAAVVRGFNGLVLNENAINEGPFTNALLGRTGGGGNEGGPYPGKGGFFGGLKNWWNSLTGGAKTGAEAGKQAYQSMRTQRTEDAFQNAYNYVNTLVQTLGQDSRLQPHAQQVGPISQKLTQMRDELSKFGQEIGGFLKGQGGESNAPPASPPPTPASPPPGATEKPAGSPAGVTSQADTGQQPNVPNASTQMNTGANAGPGGSQTNIQPPGAANSVMAGRGLPDAKPQAPQAPDFSSQSFDTGMAGSGSDPRLNTTSQTAATGRSRPMDQPHLAGMRNGPASQSADTGVNALEEPKAPAPKMPDFSSQSVDTSGPPSEISSQGDTGANALQEPQAQQNQGLKDVARGTGGRKTPSYQDDPEWQAKHDKAMKVIRGQ